MKILYVDSCVRECSRTRILARHLLGKLSGDVTEISLNEENICALDSFSLAQRESGAVCYREYAEQFARADVIVISAPYWDMSFPALLKEYIENICVTDVTFRYENGRPIGLCKAKKLYYVTTAGGPFIPDFGYGYIKALSESFFGIPKTSCFYAENLDVYGADADAVLSEVKKEIDKEFV